MSARNESVPLPQSFPIPDELKRFLEVVEGLMEGIERGIYKLDEEHTHLVDGDYLNWSFHTGISGRDIWGCPDAGFTTFAFQCGRSICGSEWHFDVTRTDIAQIASGAKTDLLLYACANPLCRFCSSDSFVRCPQCALEAGVDIAAADTTVRGLCPYCRRLLRSLSARQCPHCLMEWHDPGHPTRLGDES